jgi:hypothetical protein
MIRVSIIKPIKKFISLNYYISTLLSVRFSKVIEPFSVKCYASISMQPPLEIGCSSENIFETGRNKNKDKIIRIFFFIFLPHLSHFLLL